VDIDAEPLLDFSDKLSIYELIENKVAKRRLNEGPRCGGNSPADLATRREVAISHA
jgi:hypothetical protein